MFVWSDRKFVSTPRASVRVPTFSIWHPERWRGIRSAFCLVTLSGAASGNREPRSRTGLARKRCGDKLFCRVLSYSLFCTRSLHLVARCIRSLGRDDRGPSLLRVAGALFLTPSKILHSTFYILHLQMRSFGSLRSLRMTGGLYSSG